MGKMNKRKKEEIADDWCFKCKDGGSMRMCDLRDCLKAYHPHCVGEDDSFLEADNYWTCDSHFCFICHKVPKFKCFCCPRALCTCCIYEAEFAVVKGAKGLCIDCSRLALLIETKADVDSDGVKIDFNDKDTYEGLFKDYYEMVKEKEGLNSKHVHTAHNLLKSGKKYECDSGLGGIEGEDDTGESENECNFTVSDYDDLNDTAGVKSVRKRKCTTTKIKSTKGKVKGKKNEFIGWGSKSLIEFLQYIGKDTSRDLSEHDVASMIVEYCKVNKLFDSVKKKKVLCDAPLQSLFRRKLVNRNNIHKLLVPHFAQNSEEIEDIITSSSENRDDNKPFSPQSNLISSTHSQQNLVSEEYQNCLAAIISSNVKLVYLRRSLVEELLKQPETFDDKVMGSFVRVKTDPNDYLRTNSHQLLQVVGINRSSKNDEVDEEIRLQLSCVPKDVPICKVSDDDFSEEECNHLQQRMRHGLLKQPTVLELEQKARSLHEDIMKHWIPRELALLQNRIDRANEKGWRRELYEYMDLKLKLQTQAEQSRLLSDIPKVIPEIVDTKLSSEGSPRKDKLEQNGLPEVAILSDIPKVIPEIVDTKLSSEGSPRKDKLEQNGLPEVATGGETCNSVGHYSKHSSFARHLKNATDAAAMESSESDEDYDFSDGDSTDNDGEGYIGDSSVVLASPVAQYGAKPFWDSSPHYGYINWDHPDQETDSLFGLDVPGSWRTGDELYVGLQFDSKQAVQLALKHYSMKVHQSYITIESRPTILYVKCPNQGEGCPWRMRAIASKRTNKWQITKWGGRHNCINPLLSQDHNKLDSDFICSCIIGMVNKEPSVPITLIRERISSQFGFQISYRKAWKAKQKAIAKVFGDWDDSYELLPRWLSFMQLRAPGSVYQFDTTDVTIDNEVDNHIRKFRRVFWTFKQCCDAFNFCKPIVQIDGTFLYGKYRGTLLIATTQDGNSCVLPIAFAIVEGETLSAWSWFLSNIRQHVTTKQGLCLISSRHQSIKSAVENSGIGWQPPNAYHVYCIRHIASNFNHRFKNIRLKEDLLKLGYTTCMHQFERNLSKFRAINDDIQSWIDNISKEKWSQAHDEEGRRYGHMTTNLSETVNKVLKGARNLPITALVKCTYARMVEYFVQRGTEARAEFDSGHKYCKKLMEAIMKNREEACSHIIHKFDINTTQFEVEEAFNPITQQGGHTWCLNLQRRYCQCGRFQAYKYPCSHVIAVCEKVSIDFFQFVDPVYSLENIINAYSGEWFPIGNDECIPSSVGWTLVPDETTLRGKGRPKSTRIRNEMDWTESQCRQRCGFCKREGHNRRLCPQLLVSKETIEDEEGNG